jgi:hypothetical protein
MDVVTEESEHTAGRNGTGECAVGGRVLTTLPVTPLSLPFSLLPPAASADRSRDDRPRNDDRRTGWPTYARDRAAVPTTRRFYAVLYLYTAPSLFASIIVCCAAP